MSSLVRDAEYFTIDAETGALRLARPLWNSRMSSSTLMQWPPKYILSIAATDREGRVNHTVVTVALSPGPGAVVGPLPRFRQTTFIIKIVENAPPGYIIAALKDVLDTRPIIPVRFQLLNHNDKFAISANSGFLVTLSSLDHEVQDIFRLRVQVSGLDGLPAKLPHASEIEVRLMPQS